MPGRRAALASSTRHRRISPSRILLCPNMDGAELVQTLRSRSFHSEPTVIALSASGRVAWHRDVCADGFDAVLTKPGAFRRIV